MHNRLASETTSQVSSSLSTSQYASTWLRFQAFLLDTIMTSILTSLSCNVMFSLYPLGTGAQSIEPVVIISVAWLYYAIQESSPKQATIGKRAVGIYVTNLNGEQISFARATGRHFSKCISGLTFCLGYAMAGFTKRRQALHDIIAGTLIVKK